MISDLPKKRLFIAGTIRGGSSVVYNSLNAHSEIMVISEYVHFFRFIYNNYQPLTRNNVKKMLEEMQARLLYRNKIKLDIEQIQDELDLSVYTYANIWDAIMRFFLNKLNKIIAGEDAPNSTDSIPKFLSLFPDAKIIHVYRDPRAVLSSWKKTSRHTVEHLGVLFNCMNNLSRCRYYKSILPKNTYLSVKYEDFIQNPEPEINRLCDFVGVKYEPIMARPEKWNEVFDGVYIKRGSSSFIGEMKKGFDASRINAWKKDIEDWELCLCEWLMKYLLEEFGYELCDNSYDINTIFRGLDSLRNNRYLFRMFSKWLANDQGSDEYPKNPCDPFTWGLPLEMFKKFVDTEDGNKYLKAIEDINKRYPQIL